jgi:hypothetical protein
MHRRFDFRDISKTVGCRFLLKGTIFNNWMSRLTPVIKGNWWDMPDATDGEWIIP